MTQLYFDAASRSAVDSDGFTHDNIAAIQVGSATWFVDLKEENEQRLAAVRTSDVTTNTAAEARFLISLLRRLTPALAATNSPDAGELWEEGHRTSRRSGGLVQLSLNPAQLRREWLTAVKQLDQELADRLRQFLATRQGNSAYCTAVADH